MSKDFNDRSLIKIITENNFGLMMDDNDKKAERVMMMIWQGKEAAHCDGDIFGYSSLVHIMWSRPKRVMRRNNHSFMQIVTNFFTMNDNLNYSFQYRFRIESIQFYFYKEFLCAFLMLIIFQYVNYRYLIMFSNKVLKGDSDGNLLDLYIPSNSTIGNSSNMTSNVYVLNHTAYDLVM